MPGADAIQEAVVAEPRGPVRAIVAEHHGYRERNAAPMRARASEPIRTGTLGHLLSQLS